MNFNQGATSATAVDSLSGNQHTGSAYLYRTSANAPAYVKQAFSIIQEQNVLISFFMELFSSICNKIHGLINNYFYIFILKILLLKKKIFYLFINVINII